ncbi:uncharacterized protein LOC131246575 [Magnolia sinica]|uniref:uncharacterized protein LOC131246575 n=1 Tax=Magnolia sinica TaxID=86752 RepID=UPI002658FC22|nr:uncharacterized protein LOC131246575 [Magnolia sinica]
MICRNIEAVWFPIEAVDRHKTCRNAPSPHSIVKLWSGCEDGCDFWWILSIWRPFSTVYTGYAQAPEVFYCFFKPNGKVELVEPEYGGAISPQCTLQGHGADGYPI